MANIRRELKSYKGYPITKVNKNRYISTDFNTGEYFESNSLKGIKERIDAKINVGNLSAEMGKLLLPRNGG